MKMEGEMAYGFDTHMKSDLVLQKINLNLVLALARILSILFSVDKIGNQMCILMLIGLLYCLMQQRIQDKGMFFKSHFLIEKKVWGCNQKVMAISKPPMAAK